MLVFQRVNLFPGFHLVLNPLLTASSEKRKPTKHTNNSGSLYASNGRLPANAPVPRKTKMHPSCWSTPEEKRIPLSFRDVGCHEYHVRYGATFFGRLIEWLQFLVKTSILRMFPLKKRWNPNGKHLFFLVGFFCHKRLVPIFEFLSKVAKRKTTWQWPYCNFWGLVLVVSPFVVY